MRELALRLLALVLVTPELIVLALPALIRRAAALTLPALALPPLLAAALLRVLGLIGHVILLQRNATARCRRRQPMEQSPGQERIAGDLRGPGARLPISFDVASPTPA